MEERGELFEAIVRGDHVQARAITARALDRGEPPIQLVNLAMTPAMDEVGRRFDCSDYFVPELILSARAMKAALELLRPKLAETDAEPAGRVVIGTVKGDLHDIGKNLVAAMLEGGGFDVTDLGANVAPDTFIAAIRAKEAKLVALSALLTTTMPAMRATIEAISAAGLRDHVKILVGGAPVTQAFADEIGADGYGENAPSAVALARNAAASPDP